MNESRRERRRQAIAARKAATKMRLAVPVAPPTEPVALPWRRRASGSRLARRALADGSVWSPVLSGEVGDLSSSLATAARFVWGLGLGRGRGES